MGKIVLVILVLLSGSAGTATAAAGEFASVVNATAPGKWPGGRITWYYNPAGRPANISDAEMIAAVTTAFSEWQRVCQIEATYAGITSVPVSPTPSTTYVVGWTDFGSPEFSARGSRQRAGGTAAYAPLTGGAIQMNISRTDIRDRLDNGDFIGTLQHEIAHTFGLAHSDDPTSIMYANPYNSGTYDRTLQGDDIAACADLYGGRGVAAKVDVRNAAPEGGFDVQLRIVATTPTASVPATSLAQIDPVGGGPYYFARYWQRLRPGASLEARWVTPNGTIYRRRTATTPSGTGFLFSTLPDEDNLFQFTGRWAFQFMVDGRLAASQPFEVVRGSAIPAAPFEAAMIGEAGASGALSWRIAAYGNGGIRRTGVIANNQAITVTGFRAPPGENVVEVWAETDRPRYKPDQDDGQPATSYDVMRQVRFTAGADGLPVAALSVSETGTPDAYSAVATVAASGTGAHGVYVAAVLGGRIYYRQASGWSETPAPLVTVQAPAVASVDVLRNMDIRALPAGTLLYVGYGRSLDDLIARRLYALVRQF